LRFALFLTWCGGGISDKLVFDIINRLLSAKNQKLSKDYFACFGQFGIFRRGHPDDKDLELARQWAKELVKIDK
jgi:hypothetical protein